MAIGAIKIVKVQIRAEEKALTGNVIIGGWIFCFFCLFFNLQKRKY